MSTDSLRSVHAADNKLVSELINNKYYKCVTITNGKGPSAVSVILPARCYALARSVCLSVGHSAVLCRNVLAFSGVT